MKKHKLVKFMIIMILIIYTSAYYVASSGYYEYHMQAKTILTNEKIKEFEQDVKNNENIDVKNYLPSDEINYTNKLSYLVNSISNEGTKITRKIMKFVFKRLRYLVED